MVAYTTDESINGSAELYTTNTLTLESVLFSDRSGNRIQTITGVLPDGIFLHPNYPNPFNPVTTITYELPAGELITLSMFDMAGKQVGELVNGYQSAGIHSIEFDGNGLSSGTYVVTLKQGQQIQSKKILLLK